MLLQKSKYRYIVLWYNISYTITHFQPYSNIKQYIKGIIKHKVLNLCQYHYKIFITYKRKNTTNYFKTQQQIHFLRSKHCTFNKN